MPASARKIDANGFMLVKACPLSSVGIFDYSAGQLGLPGDPMRIVKVFRPESAVNDPAFLASLRDIPLINDHEMLSGFADDKGSTAPEDYGVDGVLTSNIYYDAPWARGDLKIFSRTMQAYLASGKQDLSLGYSCKFEEIPGVWKGQSYEVVQTNMRGNHIALVVDGRVPGARVLDGLCFDHLSFDFKPSDKEPQAMTLEQLKALAAQLVAAIEKMSAGTGAEPAAEPAAEPTAAAAPDTSAEPAAEPAAAPAAEPAAAEPGAEPAAEPAADPIASLVAEVKAALAKLEGMNGAAEPATPSAEDNVEGLQNSSPVQGAQVSVDGEGQPGGAVAEKGKELEPSATAKDAAIRGFYADSAVKDTLYQRLSKAVGAFDSRAMDSAAVAVYGVKKLGLECQKGHEMTALNMYLTGVEKGQRNQTQVAKTVQDSKIADSSELDAYLKGAQ